jgi:2,4-dienoyl-CoA reductase-like NADH-dependent reductase (Old Yellow Enzyme family)
VREVVEAVRRERPERLPLFLRISATDWAEGVWTLEDSVALAAMVRPGGVDLVDCSSDGLVAHARIPAGPGIRSPSRRRSGDGRAWRRAPCL